MFVKLNVVPVRVNPVPAEYVVLVSVSVDVIVKLGYVPLIVVAPLPVKVTVWSGAEFEKVVPLKVNPVPAEYSVVETSATIVKVPSSLEMVTPLPTNVTLAPDVMFV